MSACGQREGQISTAAGRPRNDTSGKRKSVKKEMTMQEKAEALCKKAPPLRENDEIELNKLFQAYIFRSGKEIWTTCCNRHKVLNVKDLTNEEYYVLHERNVPEPDVHWGVVRNKAEAERRVTCPYCGAEAKLKEIRYSGKRKNLWAYRRAVVLRQWRGSLWALAFDLHKSYERSLRPPVTKNLLGVYRFREGFAEGTTKAWFDGGPPRNYSARDSMNYSRPRPLQSPFTCCAEWGKVYALIGTEEVGRSAFRWCGFEEMKYKVDDPIELLTLCCFAPRKVEMLWKAGLGWAVSDLLDDHVQNYHIINWNADTPKAFLKVTPAKLREFDMNRDLCKLWLRLGKPPAEEVYAAKRILDSAFAPELFRRCREFGIKYSRLVRYMEGQGASVKNGTLGAAAGIWKDYLDAAEHIGLDLTNPLVQMPKDLNAKHDETCATWAKIQDTAKWEKYRKRFEFLQKRYAFSYDGLTVSVPTGAEDIKREGECLHHCVGGYVERHLNGATTILFLRRDENVPMVTIEMDGAKIRQIHGWDDERSACEENPERTRCEELYADFLTVWLAWLKSGSKRDKQGDPILPRKYQQQEAKTA